MEIQTRRIVIIGAGHVGSHAGYALISQGLAEEIVYIDTDEKKAQAQALDLFDSTAYLRKRAIVRAGDYTDARNAVLLIVAAGPLPDMSKGQTRMDTLRQTVEIMKDITENIRMSGFAGIILNISNPADVVTHYIQHALNWPWKKNFSTSTTLDSARLRRAIFEATGVDQKSVYAYVLGEHGESQMVPWSTVTIAASHCCSFGRNVRIPMASLTYRPSQTPGKPEDGSFWEEKVPRNLESEPQLRKWSEPYSVTRTAFYRFQYY